MLSITGKQQRGSVQRFEKTSIRHLIRPPFGDRDTHRLVRAQMGKGLSGRRARGNTHLYDSKDHISLQTKEMVHPSDGNTHLLVHCGIPSVMGILRPVRNNESADEDNYRDRIFCLGSCLLCGGGSALLCGGICNEEIPFTHKSILRTSIYMLWA